MTRVEKYRLYREEIMNMKSEDFSSKKATAQKVEEIRSLKSSSNLSYKDIMDALEGYSKNENKSHSKSLFGLRKDQIIYGVVAFATITILLVLIIIVGKTIWR